MPMPASSAFSEEKTDKVEVTEPGIPVMVHFDEESEKASSETKRVQGLKKVVAKKKQVPQENSPKKSKKKAPQSKSQHAYTKGIEGYQFVLFMVFHIFLLIHYHYFLFNLIIFLLIIFYLISLFNKIN